MDYRRFGDTLIVRIDRGEEILAQLQAVCEQEGVALASVSALGAIDDLTVGLFDVEAKQYLSNHFTGAFEIVSLTGTVTTKDGAFYPHIHISVGDREGRVFGGHLNRAVVSATCEMVIRCLDGTVEREFDETVGLNLMKF